MDRRTSDNNSQSVPAGVFSAQAVTLSASEITDTSGSITVIPGESYLFLFDSDVLLGFADPTVLVNLRWIIPAGQPVTVRMPFTGGSTLYYAKVV